MDPLHAGPSVDLDLLLVDKLANPHSPVTTHTPNTHAHGRMTITLAQLFVSLDLNLMLVDTAAKPHPP